MGCDMKRTLLTGAMALAAFAVVAEDETAAAVGAETEGLPVVQANAASARVFTALPLCRRIGGSASVRKAGGEWEPAVEGKFYPLGTSFRAEEGGTLSVAFGTGSFVTIADGSEFGTRPQALGEKSRTLVLTRGTVTLKLPDNLPEGLFAVAAPDFTIRNPAGESAITYTDKGDGDETVVLCRTGSLTINGRHFDIPAMRAADEVKIRTSHDNLFTSLYGASGNYVVRLDQGVCTREDITDEGERKTVVEKGFLDWHLSPRTKVIINRSVPAVGERMSVHTMTFDAAGVLQNERAFSEGRAEVNSGELVVKAVNGEELAKKAAELTETTAAAADTEDASATDADAASDEK